MGGNITEKRTVVLNTQTTEVRTLFLLMLTSDYSSHFGDKAMPNFGVIYPIILASFINCTKWKCLQLSY
jgi:hypothetical protein